MTVTIDGTSGINTPGVVNTAAETIATTLAVTGAATLSSTLAVTGVTTFAAGTAALPAITTTGDTNTGIFFPAADAVAVSTGGSGRVFVNSSGYFGIGKSSPESGLDIRPGITGDFNAITMGYGRAASPTDAVHKISWSSDSLNIEADTANTIASNIIFTNDGSERARINSSGALLINRTTQANTERFAITGNTGSQCMALTSPITGGYDMCNIINGNGQVGSIGTNGTATSYNTSSDYRLKNTIMPMTGALAKVSLLKPCTYKWNVDGSDGQGFIAHELDEVVSGCVSGEKDAVETYTDEEGNEATRPKYQGIDTSFLVATLTAAIQEQQALITALTTRITALEAA